MADGNDEGWTHVKIKRRTHARLMAMVESMQRMYEEGKINGWWTGEKCSVGALLNYLMNRVISHRQRAAKSRKAAQKRRADALLALTFVIV